MKPPRTVRIGVHNYKVTFSKDAINASSAKSDGQILGECDIPTTQIIVDPEQAHSQLQDTLLHETLHGCFDLIGASTDIDQDTEEKLVRRLSPVLIQVIRDNPDLLDYLIYGE